MVYSMYCLKVCHGWLACLCVKNLNGGCIVGLHSLENRYYGEALLICNDGCVVYANGVEVLRRNLPAAPAAVTYQTLANVNRDATTLSASLSFIIPNTALVNGFNYLAVEVDSWALCSLHLRSLLHHCAGPTTRMYAVCLQLPNPGAPVVVEKLGIGV